MSDLQCPARFLLLSGPDASAAQGLRHERVAAVYDGPPARTTDGGPSRAAGAAALGDALGLPVRVMARPLSLPDVLAREPTALDELRDLADLHRGETVVVLVAGEQGRRVEVAVDGDGVSVREVSRGAAT
jgi:hypothetical protein